MIDQTDRDLVRRMRDGDEAAFDQFFAGCFPRLFRFALARVGDEAAAEDIVQASLVQAVRKLHTWRGEASLFTWICTICRREIADRAGRDASRPTVALTDEHPEVRAALESLGAAVEGPDAMLERKDVGRLVQLALDYLPLRYAQVLQWKYLEDLPVHEIAERLDTTSKAAESLLSRARAAFRDAFQSLQEQARES